MRWLRALCCVVCVLLLLLSAALAAGQQPKVSVSGGRLVVSYTPDDKTLNGRLMYQLIDAEENVVESAVHQGFEWKPSCGVDGDYKAYVYYVDAQGFTCMVESDWCKATGLKADAAAVPEATANPDTEPKLLVLATAAPQATAVPQATVVPEVTAEPEAAAEATPDQDGLYITDITETEEGFVTVTWADEGEHGPYRILFKRVNVDGTTDHQVGWFYDETLTAITLTEMEPGRTYQIILRDKDNVEHDRRTITMALPEAYRGIANLKMTWTKLFNGDHMLDNPSADTLSRDYNTAKYRVRCKFTFDALRANNDFSVLCVVTAPNGFEYAHQEKIQFRYSETWTTWQWDADYMLEVMVKEFGSVIPGDYYVSTYHDGEYIGTQSFTVK